MQDSSAGIGVFDSGIGGLTVVREIIRQIPNEKIIYFGDTARVPYGSKSKDTIIKYSSQISKFLLSKNVKAIVIACNTASAYALEILQKEVSVPVIGVIYAGAKEASRITKNRRVGVIGTRATISSQIYKKNIQNINSNIDVIEQACPLLVPLVEEGLLHDTITDEIISRYVLKLKSKYIDTLVLGCTHYPLLRSSIAKIMGNEVNLVNPAYETAIELKRLLEEKKLLRKDSFSEHEFYVSDMADRFREFASSILPDETKKVYKINIEEY